MAKGVASILAVCAVLTALTGCGEDSAGVTLSATVKPTYNGVDTASVDVFQSSCQSVSDGTIQAEYYADHGATATISAGLINPSNTVKQMTVSIDRYTIEYRSPADSPGAPPIISDTREKTVSFIVSGASVTTVDISVPLVDILRKDQYLADVTSGGYTSGQSYLNNYTALYVFEGHGENGVTFSVSASTDFQIGSFNSCPSGFEPI